MLRYIFLTEICPVMHVDYAVPISAAHEGNSFTVNYTCLEGYEFTEHLDIVQVTCDEFGIWRGMPDPDDFNCRGESRKISYIACRHGMSCTLPKKKTDIKLSTLNAPMIGC